MAKRRRNIFLRILAETGNVGRAARAVGYASTTEVRKMKKNDPVFSDEWDTAVEAAGDAFESEAVRRAVEGVDKPIMYKGEIVTFVKEHSDPLLSMLLKAAKSEKYGEKSKHTVEVTHRGGIVFMPPLVADKHAWEQKSLETHANQKSLPTIDAEYTEVK